MEFNERELEVIINSLVVMQTEALISGREKIELIALEDRFLEESSRIRGTRVLPRPRAEDGNRVPDENRDIVHFR